MKQKITIIIAIVEAVVILVLTSVIILDKVVKVDKQQETSFIAEQKENNDSINLSTEAHTKEVKPAFEFKSYEDFSYLTDDVKETYLENYFKYKYNERFTVDIDNMWPIPTYTIYAKNPNKDPYSVRANTENIDMELKINSDGKIIDNYYYEKHYIDFLNYVKDKIGNNLSNYKVAIKIDSALLVESEEQLSVEKILKNDNLDSIDELSDMNITIFVTDDYKEETFDNILNQFKDCINTSIGVFKTDNIEGIKESEDEFNIARSGAIYVKSNKVVKK